jgi:type IV secretory pathway VirB10-like protein
MTNNICVFNFIRHLANLGFLAFLTIETTLDIDLSNDINLYKQLDTNYPYYLASLIKTDFIESIINTTFNKNLNVINNTNVYTNCEGNIESANKVSDTTVPKTQNQMPQNQEPQTPKTQNQMPQNQEPQTSKTQTLMPQNQEPQTSKTQKKSKKKKSKKKSKKNKSKYLKYKFKYLKLKNQMGGVIKS